ncbi:MAG: HD-GYP domain-containing protein [Spirochaetota bacterium]|nr:HD-GYP domain-containing protein [Spirochaetota bacterium]
MNTPFLDLGDKVQINLKLLTPNSVLACPTYDIEGNVIHPAYTPFTKDDIEDLISRGIDKIFYSKKKVREEQVLYVHDLKEYLKKNVYQGPRSISRETQQKAVQVMDKITETVKNNSPIDFIDDTKDVVESVMNEVYKNNLEIINLLDIESYDDFTYSHSLNAGIIAVVFAKHLEYTDNQVWDIGIGCFLHDIGKIRMPLDLINKSGPLTHEEFEIIKKHSRYGYEIVKESTEISEMVKKIILLHHEKFDGSGYPFGFKQNQIDDPVYIVSLAEFYDALTTELSYKKAFTSQETLNLLVRNSGKKFKPDLTHQFVKIMPQFLKESHYFVVGNYVKLNTNEIGKVVSKDSETTTRPNIEILTNAYGKKLHHPIPVDLNLDGSRYIERILNFIEEQSD